MSDTPPGVPLLPSRLRRRLLLVAAGFNAVLASLLFTIAALRDLTPAALLGASLLVAAALWALRVSRAAPAGFIRPRAPELLWLAPNVDRWQSLEPIFCCPWFLALRCPDGQLVVWRDSVDRETFRRCAVLARWHRPTRDADSGAQDSI